MASVFIPPQVSGGILGSQQASQAYMQAQQLQGFQVHYGNSTPIPKVKTITVPIPGWIDLHFDTGADFAFRISLITCITEKYLVYIHNGSVTNSDISGLDRAELMDKIACSANLEAAQRNLTSPAPTP